MKLRAKFLAFLLPPLLLSGLAIHFFTGRAVCDTLHEEAAAAAAAGAARVLESSTLDFTAPREQDLLPFLYDLSGGLKASYAFFAGTDGRIVAHTDVGRRGGSLPAQAGKALPGGASYALQGGGPHAFMEVLVPVSELRVHSPEELAMLGAGAPPGRLGTLALGLPLDAAYITERGIARKNAAILAGVFLAIVLMAFALATLVLRPVRQLALATERIRRGDYGAEIPVASGDELGELARSFNTMSRTLSGTIVSKNYLDAIVDNMLDMLVVTDLDGVIRKTNRAARAALVPAGLPAEGRHVTAFFPEEEGGCRWLALLREHGELRDHEDALRAGQGPGVPVLVSASFILDNEGAKAGIVAVIRDITLRKKYEAEMARSNEDLQRFAFVASHDLQEPLRTISSYIQLLENKYRATLGPDAERHVDFITGAVQRMRALVRDLLEYSKINPALRLEDVDTDEALDYVLAVLQDAVAAAGATVERGDLPVIRADRSHIERLFQNLVLNAVKFKNGGAPAVRVDARPGKGGWVFSVSDNGPGIDPAHGAKLFKLFGRLHGKGVPGAGIGLASCKRIVEYYGGEIWFESGPGEGATFFFSIPSRQ